MITMREAGERIRRRYPASIKKMGKGTLYITDRRVVFESKDYGVCLELHFRWLYEWFPIAKRKCRLSWFEPDPETKGVQLTDKPFDCEVVLERRSDQWKPDPIEFHYSLCFAYTEWVDNEQMQSGWYFGADDKMRNHYRLAGSKQKTVDEYPGDDDDPSLKYQKMHHAVETREEMAKYFKNATGERLVDQELKWRNLHLYDKDYEGSSDLTPAMSHPDGKVIPYEPEYDRLKDYYPGWKSPSFDDMAAVSCFNLSVRDAVIQGHDQRICEEVKEGKLVRGSQAWKNEKKHLHKAYAEYVLDYKLASKMADMRFETPDQWSKVRKAAKDAFKESGIKDSTDYDAISAYEPLIIDVPPAESYKNAALEEKQKYRRLLVEAA